MFLEQAHVFCPNFKHIIPLRDQQVSGGIDGNVIGARIRTDLREFDHTGDRRLVKIKLKGVGVIRDAGQ